MHKKIYKLNIIVFIAFMFIGLGLNLLKQDDEFSEMENRYLQTLPKFSIEDLIDNTFSTEFETYLNDQFVFREEFITIKAVMERLSGKLENNGIYYPTNDFLLDRFYEYDQKLATTNLNSIDQLIDKLNIPSKVVLIPSSVQMVKELPSISYDIDQQIIIDQAKAILGDDLYDPSDILSVDATSQYFKTDHHFNAIGALNTYNYLQGTTHDYEFKSVSDKFYGTLYSKSQMYWTKPDTILAPIINQEVSVKFSDDPNTYNSVFFEENLAIKDQYQYFLDGNHPLVTIDTNQSDKPDILIIRDSFGNIMTPYFLADYNKIYLYDLRDNFMTISKFLETNPVDEIMYLYSIPNFVADDNLKRLK